MSNKTNESQLLSNEKYRRTKLKCTSLNFKLKEDADLIEAIDNDDVPLAKLARQLLRKHYKLNKG